MHYLFIYIYYSNEMTQTNVLLFSDCMIILKRCIKWPMIWNRKTVCYWSTIHAYQLLKTLGSDTNWNKQLKEKFKQPLFSCSLGSNGTPQCSGQQISISHIICHEYFIINSTFYRVSVTFRCVWQRLICHHLTNLASKRCPKRSDCAY